MAAAAKLAGYRGASSALYEDTVTKLRCFDLPVIIPADMSEESILAAMMHDKKFKENKLVFILPTEIGKVEIVSDVTVEQVRQVIVELKEV
jgi:3-dehydroquinate synthase